MKKPSSPKLWIGARALLAAVLMVVFYLLALGVAGLLFWLPYADYHYGGRVHGRIALFCIIAGVTVLWSIIPRIDRFPPPGPGLNRNEQPRLFGLIDEIARLTGQAAPSEAYLIPQVNAWVSQRGGVMGIGSRRVMGIGLPLLHTLTVDEFRAVLAHEFGHFCAADTRLGPWIYKTRSAIGRTIMALESESSIGLVIVQAPFKAYGAFFLRITQAVSRAQEYAADALSARVAGARHLASGLRSIHAAAPLYDAFWRGELAPLLGAGLAPPLGEGFERFLADDAVKDARERALAAALEETATDPLDTHPALRHRLEAIDEGLEPPPETVEPKVAILLDGAEDLESKLCAFFLGERAASQLTRIPWEDAGERFYGPLVARSAAAAAAALSGVAPESLPGIATEFHARDRRLMRARPGESYLREQGTAAIHYVGSALTLAAVQAGGRIVSRPGRPAMVRAAGEEIDFFAEYRRLREGKGGADRWARIVATARIAGVDLGALQAKAPGGPPDR